MRGKRGEADMAVDWSMALLFIILCAALLVVIVSFFYRTGVDVTRVAPDVYAAKIYFSPEVLTYVEDGVVRFGTIDVEKFTDAQLRVNNEYRDELSGVKSFVAARLQLFSLDDVLIKGPIYDNPVLYKRFHPFDGTEGPGGATLKTVVYPVLLSTGEQAFLEIEMVVPND